jgi:hypothetical protein
MDHDAISLGKISLALRPPEGEAMSSAMTGK